MAQNITKHVKDMVAEANTLVETLPVEAVRDMINSDDHVIIDIRDPRELQREGKIPGAFSCPRGMLEFWIDPQSPYHKEIFNQDKTYVFYCASAWRSALSARMAQEMGLKPVAHLEGGFSAWKKAGEEIEPVE
ncbi:MAG: rhodanese-like domain-containing protein [Arenibacterium sp.]